MASPQEIYFVSDVHLGLNMNNPEEREARFVRFLKNIPRDRVKVLCLLGDIWDFWYEYRDVVPRCASRVVAQLINLMDDGVEVWFCAGNHDIWTYSYFESLGMRRFEQPYFFEFEGNRFCVGHGDALGGAKLAYRLMRGLFHCRFLQACFSLLHPWLAYRIGHSWSDSNRKTHKPYSFRNEDEPLYKFALETLKTREVDYFVFGHFHVEVDLDLPGGAKLCVLKDWIDGGTPYLSFNGSSFQLHS